MTGAVVAIDQGTTSTRALRLEPNGRAHVVHAVEHRQSYPRPGWVEHDPEELIRNIQACLAAAVAAGGVPAAIAIDNQGESCLAWDAETKEPLSQVIVWQDARSQPEVERLKRDGAEPFVLDRAGLPLDSYFSAGKLAWLMRTLPQARTLLERGRLRLGTTDAFFLDRLTGRAATDATTASRTSLLAIETGDWDPELCDLFGVPIEALPPVVPTTGDFGTISVGGHTVPVTACVVDQQAALYGHGCRRRGDAKITFGTGAFALMVTGPDLRRAPDLGILPTIAWRKDGRPADYAVDGAVYSAAAAVNWARDLGLFKTYDQINGFARGPAIERGLAFVPALSGLACPHWSRGARGTWLGLALDSGAGDLMQALLEGIALRAAEVVRTMETLTPISGAVSIDGGLAANPYFRQFLADALGRTVAIPAGGELTALGAARLAAEAADLAIPTTHDADTIAPKTDGTAWHDRFAEAVALSRRWADAAPSEGDIE